MHDSLNKKVLIMDSDDRVEKPLSLYQQKLTVVTGVKLAIVIHAEEEFDWSSGFYRSNNQVTHTDALIQFIDDILKLGGKITLAMGYPFVTSAGGKRVVEYCKHTARNEVEFAAHLHPWVCPPFDDDSDEVAEKFSYPGNLPKDLEYRKLKVLTAAIEHITGSRPKTYVAGRYGSGINTHNILKKLGYTLDLSINAYCDYTHQYGPDFSHYSNMPFCVNGIMYLPHTNSILSISPVITRILNKRPELYNQIQSHFLTRMLGKLLRIKCHRLTPEGFTLEQMKQVTEAQLDIDQKEFVVSFHSPSSMVKLTPYVRNRNDLIALKNNIHQYICWFKGLESAQLVKAQDFVATGESSNHKIGRSNNELF